MKIAAIVVTYNRLELLKKCIASLQNQTRMPDYLFIIDNASTDGTKEWVEQQCSENKIIKYIRLSENSGGAGGFNAGVEAAMSYTPDWLWLMDDDGIPAPDCLEKLIRICDMDMVGSLVLDNCDTSKLAFGLSKNIKTTKDAINAAKDGIIHGLINPFNGTLISRCLVEKIGNIKREMFIWGDETEYVFRAVAAGAKVCTLVDALFFHPTGRTKKIRLFGTKFCIEEPPAGLRRYCRFRNYAYIYKTYKFQKLIYEFIKYTVLYLLIKKFSWREYLEYLYATIDGIREKWGREKQYIKVSGPPSVSE